MLAGKTLDTTTPVLTKKQLLGDAAEQMEYLGVTVMPVVDVQTGKLVGQIERNQILSAGESTETIGELVLQEPVKIFKKQHLFNAVQLMLTYELTLLPVVDSDWVFLGVIHKNQVLELLTHMLNITEFGSVITIALTPNDFTLSEIVQIIESEGGKILGITVEAPDAEIEAYEISIKLNLSDISRIASSLRRHDYTILTESEYDSSQIDLETRADELIKYLEV